MKLEHWLCDWCGHPINRCRWVISDRTWALFTEDGKMGLPDDVCDECHEKYRALRRQIAEGRTLKEPTTA